jgi:hypothetical protein
MGHNGNLEHVYDNIPPPPGGYAARTAAPNGIETAESPFARSSH